ncbi:MAG: beta-galactosidase [Candidatus Hydrogenedentes bacterium]|nr:beta-galactosidase [Candidatus Hydrogenedentota bacterium]
MKRVCFWLLCMLAFSVAVAAQDADAGASSAGAGAAPAAAPAAFAEIWTEPGAYTQAPRVTLDVALAPSYPVTSPVPFECRMRSSGRHPGTRVTMTLTDASGTVVGSEEIVETLYDGPNACRFLWDARDAAPGAYKAVFEARYPGDDPSAVFEATVRKVTEEHLRAEQAAVTADAAALRKNLDTALSRGTRFPEMEMRLALVEEFLGRAAQDLAAGAWRSLDAKLTYGRRTLESVRAGLAFGAAPVVLTSASRPDLGVLEVRDGGFFAGDAPVFLFGIVLRRPNANAVHVLPRYGLNLAVFEIAPEDTLDASGEVLPYQGEFDALFAGAQADGVTLLAQLAPHRPGAALLDAHPEIATAGFVDVAHPLLQERFQRHIDTVVPYLAAQSAVSMLSIVHTPRFRFLEEPVRQQFIAHVQTLYEDRQALNQSWRAHLANYEEILIGDAPGQYDYRQKRAYQWDWQVFHRGLGVQYLRSLRDAVKQLAPAKPLMATLPDNVFEPGESRDGLDREAVAGMMDITGCTTRLSPASDLYAYRYPDQSAFCTVMRSMEPEKPVVCAENQITVDASLTPGYAYGYVYTAVWDAVVSGLSAMALPGDSAVFLRPETFEAFAAAALDINRLSPVVHAIQRAPADVGILWSDSAKVFDDGDPYLLSARFAYEGCSFSGYAVRYITENQCVSGDLGLLKVLVIPETPALRNDAFAAVQGFVEQGGTVARVGKPIPYNERGHSRQDVIRNTSNTVLVRGMNLPTEYLHAMDAAIVLGSLEDISRPINGHGYPLEGVKTRMVEWQGDTYLFVVNMRPEPILCYLSGAQHAGTDLISGRRVEFPNLLDPLEPMLVRLDSAVPEKILTSR